ncbi:MAG: ATP-binding cassette domain-containing protein, partial [Bacteroidales bacterium]|nr:ATP-binding cassette domain-containing protein [Bacteroidales bacterium]
DKKLLDKIIEITGLDPEQNKKIGALSKGYRQRVGLAQALIHNPEVLILDEPTSGLDPNQIIEIRNLIRETGIDKTVMLSTHIMQEVEAICHRIIIIDRGSIVANEEKEKIYSIISKAKQYLHVEFDRAINSNELTDIASVGSVKMLKENEYLIEADTADDIRPLIFSFAVRNNLTILSLQKKESNLEEVFRKLTIG